MDFETTLKLSQKRLSEEEGNLGNLLELAKGWTHECLISGNEWDNILEQARHLPKSMGAFPFGFEFPLHDERPVADFGASLTGGTLTGNIFTDRAKSSGSNKLAIAIANLLNLLDSKDPKLRSIVGRKVMLEFDVGSAKNGIPELPGFFLRPGNIPIYGNENKQNDVLSLSNALYSVANWKLNYRERQNLELIYKSQPANTRLDSFGVFPSRSRGIRLAIMGFNSPEQVKDYLQSTDWQGDGSKVQKTIQSLQDKTQIARYGINLDVREEGLGQELGLTTMVKQRYTNDRRYWLDDSDLWDSFLDALRKEKCVLKDKLLALKGWMSKPEMNFSKSGCFVILRGIHHIKLVISDGDVSKAKAYVFMVLIAI